MQTIATNKKANHNYLIEEKFEAGLVLTGAEVKSLRVNNGSIKESYIMEKGGQLWLTNCHIKKYSSSIEKKNNPTREKKILVNKKELNKITGSSKKEGMSVIPLLLYFNDKGLAKMTIGLGKGKKKYDKRSAIKSREWAINKQRIEKNKEI